MYVRQVKFLLRYCAQWAVPLFGLTVQKPQFKIQSCFVISLTSISFSQALVIWLKHSVNDLWLLLWLAFHIRSSKQLKQFSIVLGLWLKIDFFGHSLMLLWFKDLMNVTEKLQFIDPTFWHSCLVPWSGVI